MQKGDDEREAEQDGWACRAPRAVSTLLRCLFAFPRFGEVVLAVLVSFVFFRYIFSFVSYKTLSFFNGSAAAFEV